MYKKLIHLEFFFILKYFVTFIKLCVNFQFRDESFFKLQLIVFVASGVMDREVENAYFNFNPLGSSTLRGYMSLVTSVFTSSNYFSF